MSSVTTRTAKIHLVGLSPYSPSKAYNPDVDPQQDGESSDAYERRVWRNRIHRAEDGTVLIPAMMIQFMLQFSAKRLGLKRKGKGGATYTKHFEGGVVVADDGRIEGTHFEKVRGQWLHLNADGKRGGGTRVWRQMPMVDKWETVVDVHVIDPVIEEEVFERVLRDGGAFCGFGRFSPRKGGTNGRFRVESCEWSEQ